MWPAVLAMSLDSGHDGVRIRAGKSVPADVSGLYPLRFFSKGDARDLQVVCLLLDASRIGENRRGGSLELQHVQIPHWLDHAHIEPGRQTELRQPLSSAWVEGEHHRVIQ